LTLAGTGQDTFSEGIVTQASFNWPWKPISLPNGDILMTDRLNNRIRRITVDQRVEVEAGSGEKSGTDGFALRAAFNDPSYLFKGAGNDIYITEGHGSRLRLLSGGKVTTIAGDGTKGFRDGPAHVAQFAIILGGCWIPTGEIFLADNENNRVRVVERDMIVTSIGTGTAASVDGPKEHASFNQPIGMAVAPSGEIFLSERYRIRHIDKNRRVITFAGTTQGDRDGPKETAQFNNVRDLLFAPNSELFISDSNNHKLKRIDLLGIVTTITGKKDGWKDGPLASALFNRPAGLCFNLQGGLLIADCDNSKLRIIPDMVSMTQSPFASAIDLQPLLHHPEHTHFLKLTPYSHEASESVFYIHSPFLSLVFPALNQQGINKLCTSKVSFQTIKNFLTLVYSGTIPEVTYLDLIEIFYLSYTCSLPPEFSLAVRKKMFMMMGTLDSDSLIRALYHVQAMCDSLVELIDMLVRALKPLFEASMIPKLTALVSIDEKFAQQVLMGLYSQPVPPVDVKPLEATTESYIVNQLERLYWSMLLAQGASTSVMPHGIELLNPLPKDLHPDFNIMLGDQAISCHSWVLFGRWPYFRRMMASGLGEVDSMTMSLPDDCWSVSTMRAFLRYLYTNSVGLFDTTDKTCMELLDNARLFDLLDVDNNPTPGFGPLIEHCTAPHSTNVTIRTAVSSYQRLLLYGSSAQRKQLRKFIAQNISSIMADDKLCAEFASLGSKTCATILFAVHDREYPSGASLTQQLPAVPLSASNSAVPSSSATPTAAAATVASATPSTPSLTSSKGNRKHK
jgi:hypothetical protein